MGALDVNMFTSLDGVLQGPGGPEEDRAGGFEYGGWQAPLLDEESGKVITDHIAGLEALLLGRKTYEIFAAYWPEQPAENPIAARLNSAPKYVASRTLDTVGWTNSTLIQEGDAADAVARLKQEPGKGLFTGGVTLPLALAELGLIDEYEFVVHPRLAGHGPTLFAGLSKHVDLKLVSRLEFGSGAVAMRYVPRR